MEQNISKIFYYAKFKQYLGPDRKETRYVYIDTNEICSIAEVVDPSSNKAYTAIYVGSNRHAVAHSCSEVFKLIDQTCEAKDRAWDKMYETQAKKSKAGKPALPSEY